MWLAIGGWRMYHEASCSPGLPWDCEKRCVLWRLWDQQNRQDAERAARESLDAEAKPAADSSALT